MREHIQSYKLDESNPGVPNLIKNLIYFKELFNKIEYDKLGEHDDQIIDELKKETKITKNEYCPLEKFQPNTLSSREVDNEFIDFKNRIILFKVYNKCNELRSFLKHIRNSYAHNHIYVKKTKNNTYLVMTDEDKKKPTAVMVFTHADLKKWKKILERYYN